MTTRKCKRHARERHANAKSFHACVFLLSNSEKLRENIQNNTKTKQHKIWAAYVKTITQTDECQDRVNKAGCGSTKETKENQKGKLVQKMLINLGPRAFALRTVFNRYCNTVVPHCACDFPPKILCLCHRLTAKALGPRLDVNISLSKIIFQIFFEIFKKSILDIVVSEYVVRLMKLSLNIFEKCV